MKSKSLLIFICSVGFVLESASAATLSLSRGSGNPGVIASVNSAPLSSGGYYIAAGTFTNASGVTEVPVITTSFSSLLAAVAAFDVFASVVAPISGATIATITGSFNGTGGSTPSDFQNKPIYFLVGNGATQGASTAWGIFSLAPSVNYPADVVSAGTTLLSLPNGTGLTPLANAGTVTGNNLNLVVPEPSTALLGALGALGLLRRRRN